MPRSGVSSKFEEDGDMHQLRAVALMSALGALLIVPAVGQAKPDAARGGKSDDAGEAKPDAQRGAKPDRTRGGKCVTNKGFIVKGTLVSVTADDPATPDDEQSVTLTVTKLNKHASRAGLTDADEATEGTQYVIAATDDAFGLKLSGYEAPDEPAAGDKVRVVG